MTEMDCRTIKDPQEGVWSRGLKEHLDQPVDYQGKASDTLTQWQFWRSN